MSVLRFIFKDWWGMFLLPAVLLIPLGALLVVPIGMLWRYEDTPKPNHPTYLPYWKYIRLPKLLWIWESKSGLMGDRSYSGTYKWHPRTWLGQWYWTSVRNPIRGWKVDVAGIELDGTQKIYYRGSYEVDDVTGKFGWQFVTTKVGGRTARGFYAVIRLTDKRCLRIRAGYKVKPSYKGISRMVGGSPGSISIKAYRK